MTEQFTAERGKTGLMKLKSNKLRGAVATLHYGHLHASLFSAGPELLETCRAIVALADGQGRMNMLEVAGMARRAIDRAEGDR